MDTGITGNAAVNMMQVQELTSISQGNRSLEVSCIVANSSIPCCHVVLVGVVCDLGTGYNALLASGGCHNHLGVLC